MGYESKIFIVEKYHYPCKIDGKEFASFIASYDFGKFPMFSDFMRKCPKTNCFIYMDDGNTKILEDRYDKELTECSIDEAINILAKSIKEEGCNYRRVMPIFSMLKTLSKQEKNGEWRKLAVLHFGH